MTFLTHPEHGATNVRPGEVPDLEKQGWTVTTPEAWMAAKHAPKQAPMFEQPKRRGRPPKAE